MLQNKSLITILAKSNENIYNIIRNKNHITGGNNMSNLKDERIMILEMVREGKISTDDATKLLSSLGGGSSSSKGFDNEEDFEDKLNKFYSSVDTFAKDLKDRFGKVYKDAEPKVKEVTHKAMKKTASIMEDLSEKLNEKVNEINKDKEETGCCCGSEDKTEEEN